MTKVEIEISRKVSVPEKYGEIIGILAHDDEAFPLQEWADEMVKQLRISAAKAGMEVDEFIDAAIAEERTAKASSRGIHASLPFVG